MGGRTEELRSVTRAEYSARRNQLHACVPRFPGVGTKETGGRTIIFILSQKRRGEKKVSEHLACKRVRLGAYGIYIG